MHKHIDADALMDKLRGDVLVDVTPALEDSIAEMPAADVEPVRKWISVDEQLPEIDTDVLIFSKGYDASRVVAYLDGDNLQWYDSLSYVQIVKSDVIAWQPLSEPPKMDGGSE